MPISYQQIEQLLVSANIKGHTIICQFQVPGAKEIIEATAPIEATAAKRNTMVSNMKRGMRDEVRRMAYRGLRQIFGHGTLSRTGSKLVDSFLQNKTQQADSFEYTKEAKETAILEAFQTVAHHFIFDEDANKWYYRKALGEYEAHLKEHPVTNEFDKDILRRLLIELAQETDNISWQEEQFLMDLLNITPMELAELQLKDSVSPLEAKSVSEKVKPTIFLLLNTIALVDEQLDAEELEYLNKVAERFGISIEKKKRLAAIAKNKVLESAFSISATRDQLNEMAQQLKMTNEEVEKAFIEYKKRMFK